MDANIFTIQAIHTITEPTRFRLIQLLFKHHYCVRALSKKLNISESAVSQHIRVLKECGIVYGKKIGYQVHYQVSRQQISSILREASEQISQYPAETELSRDCSCEFIFDCIRRDTNQLEEPSFEE